MRHGIFSWLNLNLQIFNIFYVLRRSKEKEKEELSYSSLVLFIHSFIYLFIFSSTSGTFFLSFLAMVVNAH